MADSSLAAKPCVFGGVQQLRRDLWRVRLPMVNVFFIGAPNEDWVLIDAGLPAMAGLIRRAAEQIYGQRPPRAVVLTHGHLDHIGSLHALLKCWPVPVYAHPFELPYLTGEVPYPFPDPAVGGGTSLTSPLFVPGPFDFKPHVQALRHAGELPGLPDWRWIHTPGHTEGHLSLWRAADRTLIAGDAVVTTPQETLLGALFSEPVVLRRPPAYYTPNWEASRESVRVLASLQPQLIATGHGQPMARADLAASLEELGRTFDHNPNGRPTHGWYLTHPVPTGRPQSGRPDPLRKLVLGGVGAAAAAWLLTRRR